MIRISTIFIAICMVLIAASLGLILYSLTSLTVSEAGLVALTALTFLILYNAVSMRLRDRTDVGGQIADLSRGTADLARQIAEFGRRMASMETRLTAIDIAGQERVQAAMGEIGELGVLLSQIADSVAAHDEAITGLGTHPQKTAEVIDTQHELGIVSLSSAPAIHAAPITAKSADTPINVAPLSESAVTAAIRSAVETNRIDLYLQPMVSLPQRKVRFYEAVSRLRDDKDRVLTASEFIGAAESSGLISQIDYMVIFRCVQVLRRLQVRSKDVGVFCNLSTATLGRTEVFSRCIDFLEANRALAPWLVFEFKHSAFRKLGPVESENLAKLSRLGFKFSIDNVGDLRIDGRELADRGVNYVKIPANLLLDQKQLSSADIHAADLASLLGRFGINLIAEKIEGERAVVDLLDYDVKFGQGFLFSAPRPLRPEGANGEGPETTGSAAKGTTSTAPPQASSDARLTGTAALARRIAQS